MLCSELRCISAGRVSQIALAGFPGRPDWPTRKTLWAETASSIRRYEAVITCRRTVALCYSDHPSR